tara:strand:+ start:1249 stop:1389 length:141 start_codon:yes stop_codon:yes gene_type:complete
MIKYNLICDKEHEFESWFSDSLKFEKLKKKNYWSVYIAPLKKLKNQ